MCSSLLEELNDEGRTIVLITHERDIALIVRRAGRCEIRDGADLAARQRPRRPAAEVTS